MKARSCSRQRRTLESVHDLHIPEIVAAVEASRIAPRRAALAQQLLADSASMSSSILGSESALPVRVYAESSGEMLNHQENTPHS